MVQIFAKGGEQQTRIFGRAIEVYTRQITAELLETKFAVAGENT
jgi:hypothetical protein